MENTRWFAKELLLARAERNVGRQWTQFTRRRKLCKLTVCTCLTSTDPCYLALSSKYFFFVASWQMCWWNDIWKTTTMWGMQRRSTCVQVCYKNTHNVIINGHYCFHANINNRFSWKVTKSVIFSVIIN